MNKLRLVIADADPAHVRQVRHALSGRSAIEIVGIAASGAIALEMLNACQPDVLLADVQLPELDGFSLLRASHRLRRPPVAILCSRFYSDLVVEHASRCGAAYFLYKPFDLDRLAPIIEECYRRNRGDLDESAAAGEVRDIARVRALLQDMGIPARLSGAMYIIEAVMRQRGNRLLLRNLNSGLYEELSSRLGSSPARIERAIRNAISVGYERGTLPSFFPTRPSNKALLEYIVRRLDESTENTPR